MTWCDVHEKWPNAKHLEFSSTINHGTVLYPSFWRLSSRIPCRSLKASPDLGGRPWLGHAWRTQIQTLEPESGLKQHSVMFTWILGISLPSNFRTGSCHTGLEACSLNSPKLRAAVLSCSVRCKREGMMLILSLSGFSSTNLPFFHLIIVVKLTVPEPTDVDMMLTSHSPARLLLRTRNTMPSDRCDIPHQSWIK